MNPVSYDLKHRQQLIVIKQHLTCEAICLVGLFKHILVQIPAQSYPSFEYSWSPDEFFENTVF